MANLRFWNYVGESEATRGPWEFDEQRPEASVRSLSELRDIALLLVTEFDFLSPPTLWSGNTKRTRKWGVRLVDGDFNEWSKVQRISGQIWAAVFYPSCKRNYDFMLCVNKYVPVALTRIQDANVRSNRSELKSLCRSVGLQFGYTTERPILLPDKPESCSLSAVRTFVNQLEQLRTKVGCSIRELGEIPRFG